MLSEWIRVAALVVSGLVAQDAVVPSPTTPGELAAPVPQVAGMGKLSGDSSVDQVLDALDQRGKGLKDFSADVTLAETDKTLGDTTSRKGTAVYQKKGDENARIHIVFNSKQQGKKITNNKREYLLDNGWLTDRDYDQKTEVRRQVLRPGEKIDLLKLGEGPFPLPVGQPRESVLKAFEVTKGTPAKDDPADAVHIVLKPREGTSFARKFATIDVWVDLKTEMPKRIQTLDVSGTTQRRTDLEIKSVNGGLKDGDFVLEPIEGDWNRHDEPYAE
jgi:outer membrane lipoprotein-sorting protein